MKSRTVPTWVFRKRKKRERETKGGGERKVEVKKSGCKVSYVCRMGVYDSIYDYMSDQC